MTKRLLEKKMQATKLKQKKKHKTKNRTNIKELNLA